MLERTGRTITLYRRYQEGPLMFNVIVTSTCEQRSEWRQKHAR